MGIPVLIIGRSGSGKSTSLRNFTNNISVINVLGKRLPFKNKLPTVKSDNYNDIMAKLAKSSNTSIVNKWMESEIAKIQLKGQTARKRGLGK